MAVGTLEHWKKRFQKKVRFSLMSRPFTTPPLLMAQPLREELSFAASLTEGKFWGIIYRAPPYWMISIFKFSAFMFFFTAFLWKFSVRIILLTLVAIFLVFTKIDNKMYNIFRPIMKFYCKNNDLK